MRRICDGSNGLGILHLEIRDDGVDGGRVERGVDVEVDNVIVEIVVGIEVIKRLSLTERVEGSLEENSKVA
ncbi:hypothetical protein DVH24_038663 [Malus domestica]|uniref:Uncharacterized protein n=1 Tax=Malus domestica TaxID=3750 RepID=A0A498K7Y6_MALDO|nr:hypothetical protein DVH24_038663 [Malus domestica]